MPQPLTKLIISNYQLTTNLGVTASERAKKQTVLLNIEIIFPVPPIACVTDAIEETFCYDDLVAKIKEFCRGRQFNLIEFLGWQLFTCIKKIVKQEGKIVLSVTKFPKTPNLEKTIFSISD